MGKKKKAPPKPWQNNFEGLSDGMEMFWKEAQKNIHEKRAAALMLEIDKLQIEGGTELVCRKGNYPSFPDRILDLKGLTKIDLSHNILDDDIPEAVWESPALESLTHLDLSFNQLTHLPADRDEIGLYKNLANVTFLDISHNQLVELPAALKELVKLKEVHMTHGEVQDFREEWTAWKHLTYLDCSYNKYSSLPRLVSSWTELKVLKARSNSFIALPETLGECKKLEVLNMAYNAIQDLPECVGNLERLEELDLSHNGLANLPEQIAQLGCLKKLYLGRNSLKPSAVAHICGLVKLEDLYMPKNLLHGLPKEIGQLVNLRNVSFAGNLMKSLPKEVGEWTKVEEVYLSGNDYEALPNSIQEWKNLKELHLRNCDKLSVINPKVAFPKTLMRIDLRETQVELPDEWQEPPKGIIEKRIPPFYILGPAKKKGAKKK